MTASGVSEVVVVGAGPVGLTFAALLATGPAAERLRVRVIDAQGPPEWSAERMDLRVYALSRASQRALERLAVWSEIHARRASPYRRMRVWEGELGASGSLEFDAAEIGEPDLGHIVEDNLIRERLARVLLERRGVELRFATTLEALDESSSSIRVKLTSGEILSATLVVAADGAHSRVRALGKIPAHEHSYGQHAIVAHVATTVPHAETAWQRFLPGGPLAFLPLADGRSSIVWSLPSPRAETLLGAGDAHFVEALQEASGGVLGALELRSLRAAFPLKRVRAHDYCRRGVVLVGDAAHCVHPLAGQGMNLGLADAVCLADTLSAACLAGEHIGDLRVLNRYVRARKGANLAMQLAFDALDRLFRLDDWAMPIRKLGLAAVDELPVVKRMLMRRALGGSYRMSGYEAP
jgi:ubiquinone biosynthesis UbiH/UbiF/VisC/COQ6 family hydroxylase